jgi:DNA-binding NarL/FixJ family response regulator
MPPRCHVAVTSDQSLIADSVGAALAGLDLVVSRPEWPWHGRTPSLAETVHVGVMLSELHPVARLTEAQHLARSVPVPWILLTDTRRGPVWGAMLEAGAVAVLPSTCSLDQLRAAVARVAAGEPIMDRQLATQLREAWRSVDSDGMGAMDRIRMLTPRETLVLGLLHDGEAVRQIAERLGVTQATVRTQVRGILRKLEVGNQLAAVAAYGAAKAERLLDADPG